MIEYYEAETGQPYKFDTETLEVTKWDGSPAKFSMIADLHHKAIPITAGEFGRLCAIEAAASRRLKKAT